MEQDMEGWLQARGEVLLVDVAIHLMVDVPEARQRLGPLLESGRVEIFWRSMSTPLRVLCECDREEVVRWAAKA